MSEYVKKYYDNPIGSYKELVRLNDAYARIEYLSTIRLMEKYFPKSGRIIDIGSGPGKYSAFLLKKRYSVTLCDLSNELLNIAQGQLENENLKANDFICADAADLSMIADNQFDAALVCGPLYHTVSSEKRLLIYKEAQRIVKKGGVIIFAYLNSWGILRIGVHDFPQLYEDSHYLKSFLE